jgi:hypothetical protein
LAGLIEYETYAVPHPSLPFCSKLLDSRLGGNDGLSGVELYTGKKRIVTDQSFSSHLA